MDAKDKYRAENLGKILPLLNQSLKLEYSLIIHYPRLARVIQDDDTRKLALELGRASISHADTVASAITRLGGSPQWTFGSLPEESNAIKVFQVQLEKEKTALQLHKQIANPFRDSSLREEFNKLAEEEYLHIGIAEKILSQLSQLPGVGPR